MSDQNIITIRVDGTVSGAAARSIGETLIGHGYQVRSVLLDRSESTTLWRPMFVTGQRVQAISDSTLGTVIELLPRVGEIYYRVKWDDSEWPCPMHESEIAPVKAKEV